MDIIQKFLKDQRGQTSIPIKILLAVTLGAAAAVILLQNLHTQKELTLNTSKTIKAGAEKALTNTMQAITD